MEPDDSTFSRLYQALVDELRSKRDHLPNSVPAQDPSQATRYLLDEEIEFTELALNGLESYFSRKLAALRLRRNQLAPILRLPNETLSSIFSFASRSLTDYLSAIRLLLTISSVSRVWREIALRSPRLWTRLERSPLPLLSLFLTRSKQAPLEVAFDTSYTASGARFSSCVALVSPHAHRLRRCILRCQEAEVFKSLVLLPAPYLEILVLDCGPYFDIQAYDYSELFLHPFAGHTPALRELTLEGVFVPPAHRIYSNLIKLRLSHIVYTRPEAMRDFPKLFEAAPLLEELYLGRLYFFPTPDAAPHASWPPGPATHLSHLRTLDIRHITPESVPAYLLSHIILPPTTRFTLSMHTNLNGDIPDVTSPFSDTHSNRLPNLSSISALFIENQGFQYVLRGDTRQSSGSFSLELTANEWAPMLATISKLGRGFSMPYLKSVHISDLKSTIHAEAAIAIRAFLDRHSSIEELELDNCHSSMIEVPLMTNPQHICPQLKCLIIKGCSLNPTKLIEIVEARTKPNGSVLGSRSGLEADETCLESLCLVGCSMLTEMQLSALRERLSVTYSQERP
ncbi:hypothetical protein BOTBODRAFT_184463 [Botryobasidium botryosum FD-172 SS1]|uniref:F-box domain-containing protein n=1 Tax=Botryobasidium botryosum (strain FD-172 SS1) TaxID=930990 RepID=A0A067N6P7_BOTB1|nr:hypothetical protein BOTBODRAFT_184463 [Botryobasidium botryosum FD-172 SS1]